MIKLFLQSLVIILLSLVLVSCSDETVDLSELVKTNNKYFKKFSDEPFTGNVTGLEKGRIKNGIKIGEWRRWSTKGNLLAKYTCKNRKLVSCESYETFKYFDDNISYCTTIILPKRIPRSYLEDNGVNCL